MQLDLRAPDDFHVHLRQPSIAGFLAIESSKQFARVLVMPNTLPPITSGAAALRYKDSILRGSGDTIITLMTIKLLPTTTPEIIKEAKECGVIAAKLYPAGATTHSDDGVVDLKPLQPVFEAMADVGMVLCIHAEDPNVFVLEREGAYVDRLRWLIKNFPSLKMVIEHISTARLVHFVEVGPPTLAATITPQHLHITLDDVIGGFLAPHNFCKPIVKTPRDREALLRAATGGNPKFFLGTDSAPHPTLEKHSDRIPAGVFSSPVAMPLLASVFEERGALARLEDFTSRFGAEFYGLPLNKERIVLTKALWEVPNQIGDFAPFLSGTTLPWRIS